MSANVALTDTFDQWRVKTNEVVVMTQTDGMSNFIKTLDTTNSTSNTTGSIITAGGVGITKSVVIGENLRIHGNLITDGDTTISGNLIFGDAATDQVTFSADINSSLIPNANLTFNIGNTTQQWANAWAGHVGITQKTDSGKPALTVTSQDVDQIAVSVTASQTTADVLDIAADSLTTGKVIDITSDALTTGSALYIDSDSSATDTRSIATIIQNHASATGSTGLTVQSDAGRGVFIDTNLAAGGFALEIDSEQTTTNVAKIASIATSGTVLEVSQVGIMTGKVIDITADAATTGTGINMSMDGLTTGSAIVVDSNSSDTGTRNIASITQNHASATGATALAVVADAGRGLFIDSNLAAGGYALEVDAEITTTNTAKIAAISTSGTTLEISSVGVLTGKVIDITADAATTGIGINMSMNGLTTGSALAIDSNSADTGTRNIASIIQNHASASGSTTLYLQQDHATADALKVVGAVTVGVDGTGHDVKFFGATSSAYMLWDENVDDLVLAGAAGIDLAGDIDVDGTANLDVVDIDGAVQIDGTVTVGVDDTSFDVKFFGATAATYMLWDETDDRLVIRGPVGTGATGAGVLRLETAETSVVDADQLGRIEFIAPLEAGGTDAILVGASIYAEADDTFAADNNRTELVFATGASEAAAEKMRIAYNGYVGMGTATPSTQLEVAGVITETSIREMKTNISNMENMLPAVLQMQGVKFDFKNDPQATDNYGFIAEDMDEILPNLVSHNVEGKPRGIQYTKLTAVLVEAIKEQQVQIDELKAKLN